MTECSRMPADDRNLTVIFRAPIARELRLEDLSPEEQAAIKVVAKRWAEAIDAEIAERVYGEMRHRGPR